MNMNATLLGQAITFVLFVWFCMKFIWPPVKRARDELKQQVASLAIAGAEKIIERSVNEAANSDIIDKLVAEL